MVIETKTDLPAEYKTRTAAEILASLMPKGCIAVYLGGYGALRDWDGGVGRIFNEYFEKISTVFIPQDDYPRPRRLDGYRPLLKRPRRLKVNGAVAGILFDTSDKSFMIVNGVSIPSSPSQIGLLVDILRLSDYLELHKLASSVTFDHWGVSTSPIEHVYKEKGRSYIGPRKFLGLNIISFKDAAEILKNNTSYNQLKEQLKRGELISRSLHRYETYLRNRGIYNGKTPLDELIIPRLDLIVESDETPESNDMVPTMAGGVRHA